MTTESDSNFNDQKKVENLDESNNLITAPESGSKDSVINAKPPSPTKIYGVTSPINLNKPTKADIERTKELMAQLKEYNIFETNDELAKKFVALDKLNKLTKSWICEFLIKRRMPESDAKAVGGHIRTFGSYRLGVHTKGGDIDAVMIVPRHLDRNDFFESFSAFIKGRSDVKNLRCVVDAYVPVMKFSFKDIDFDLLFCRISKYQIPDDMDLKSPTILRDMDIRDIRSINGFRIADEILSLVPNQKSFKITLHAIKFWAKRHELYSNILGFFGGITWAIMVARVCQLYPNAAPGVLVHKFFLVYTNWDWDKHPILLKEIVYCPSGISLPQWHIKGVDQNKLMPIVTPTFPEQNTTHNITISTRTIILNRFREALLITDKILKCLSTWNELFTPTNFFQSYVHFLVLTADSGSAVKFLEWNGFVESKLRLLVMTLEKNIYIKTAHPHCISYEALPSENAPFIRRWFIGLDIQRSDDQTGINIDLSQEILKFTNDLLLKSNSSFFYPNKTVSFNHVKRKDLIKYLPRETIGRKVKTVQSATQSETLSSTLSQDLMNDSSSFLKPSIAQNNKRTADCLESEEDPSSEKKKNIESNLNGVINPPPSEDYHSPPVMDNPSSPTSTPLNTANSSNAINA